MIIDMGADWNHLLMVAATITWILTGVLAALCAAAGLCARADSDKNRKPQSSERMTL